MNEAVIVAAKRSAIGSFGGVFKKMSAVDLGTQVLKETLNAIQLDPTEIDEVILGNVLSAGLGQNVARQVSLNAGVPKEAPAVSINQVCGSGLRSVMLAAQAVLLGDSQVVVAGGTESMSNAPYLLPDQRFGAKMGDKKVIDSMLRDGLTDAFDGQHMGVTAENIVEEYGFSREQQDELAKISQNRAEEAIKNKKFKEEIVPIRVPNRKGDDLVVSEDEYPRFNTTMESLGRLKPAFKTDGSVTAGNASGINDGAAIIIVMSRQKADQLGLKPLASIYSYATGGVDPKIMGTGPIPATRKALDKVNLQVKDLDLIEANEAFAAQALSVIETLGFDTEIVNVNGGAIALGHPIGASGARITVSLLSEMQKRKANLGLSTLCIGGGQGAAMIFKNESGK